MGAQMSPLAFRAQPSQSAAPNHVRCWGEARRLTGCSLTVPRLRTLHRAEDIGSALKGGVNVCQRQLVNEVLGPLVTEFVPKFDREGATPIQRGSNAGLLHRVQAIKLIRHIMRAPTSQRRPSARWSPVARTGFKVVPANSGPWRHPPARAGFSFWRKTSRLAQ